MLDHRVYRAAFLPALLALMLVAFSLGDRPDPATTRVAPDAFQGGRAFGAVRAPLPGTLVGMAETYAERRPGSAGDAALAGFVERTFVQSGFADAEYVRTAEIEADTPAGRATLRTVVAERQGLESRRLLVVAHRDALAAPGLAELSGTAVLLELARILADRDLRMTVVLASTSGGSGGAAGAREALRLAGGRVDAAIVLGDLASARTRRPWVVPWSADGRPAPHGLRRTVEAALRAETGADPGDVRTLSQMARRVVPVTVGEQGPINAAGVPAVLVSASGELGPRPGAKVRRQRLTSFGRGVLRALTAIETSLTAGGPRVDAGEGVTMLGRLIPDWAVRLLALCLLLPAALGAVDAYFRVRRRRLRAERWLAWAASWALPFLAAYLWLRALDLVGAIPALPAPAPPGNAEVTVAVIAAVVSAVAVAGLGFYARSLWLAGTGPGAAAGGAAAAVAVLTSALALLVWSGNPYAGLVLAAAAHAWLLVPAPDSRLRGAAAWGAAALGLLPAALVALVLILTLDLSAAETVRMGFDLLAGGETGLRDALALSLLGGLACATAAILRARGRAERQAPAEPLRTRGPRGYAGPGSLGGTDSALRR